MSGQTKVRRCVHRQAGSPAVIFDLDGTLTRPALDFDAIRTEIGRRIGVPVEGPILEALEDLSPDTRELAKSILTRHERLAAETAALYDGAVDVIETLRRARFGVAILTRNSRVSVDTILGRFRLEVDALRTRDDGAIKPSAKPVRSLCRELETEPSNAWVVGDYLFDIESGRAAGTRTVLMIGESAPPPFADQAHHVIRRLMDLLPIVGLEPESRSVTPAVPAR